MYIGNLIRKDYGVAGPYESVASIEGSLSKQSFLVVLEGQKFLGVLTHSDIAGYQNRVVADCLKDKPRIDYKDKIESALELMKKTRNPVLAVFKAGRFTGVITQDDIADYLSEYHRDLAEEVDLRNAELTKAVKQLRHENRRREDAEHAMRESEQKYKTLVSQVPGAVYRCAFDGRRTMSFVSIAIKEISGYPFSYFVKNRIFSYDQIIHPYDRKIVKKTLHDSVKRKKPYFLEYRIVHADKAIRWVREQGQTAFGKRGEALWLDGVIFDITERKRVEEELEKHQFDLESKVEERTEDLLTANEALQREIVERERLEKEILTITERQQQRIGQELHDGLGQLLTGIALTSKVLEQDLAAKSMTEAASVARIAKLVNQGISQTRNLARGFYPVDLHTHGLVSALRSLVTNMEQLFDISCRFNCDESIDVDDIATKIQLYRIAQEAITNAIKHGKAKDILIGMKCRNDITTLTIENDGLPLPQQRGDSAGMGLRIMCHRARVINASLDIRPGENGGTVVECSFENKIQQAQDKENLCRPKEQENQVLI